MRRRQPAGGGFAPSAPELARRGHLPFDGAAAPEPYRDRLRDGVPMDPDLAGLLYGAGMAIHADTPRGPVNGYGGWIAGGLSRLRHDAGHGVTVASRINTDAGFLGGSSGLVPVLEAALADLALEYASPGSGP